MTATPIRPAIFATEESGPLTDAELVAGTLEGDPCAFDVLVERQEGSGVSGRSYRDAPEVDGAVHLDAPAVPGAITRARIERVEPYDLYGSPVSGAASR